MTLWVPPWSYESWFLIVRLRFRRNCDFVSILRIFGWNQIDSLINHTHMHDWLKWKIDRTRHTRRHLFKDVIVKRISIVNWESGKLENDFRTQEVAVSHSSVTWSLHVLCSYLHLQYTSIYMVARGVAWIHHVRYFQLSSLPFLWSEKKISHYFVNYWE